MRENIENFYTAVTNTLKLRKAYLQGLMHEGITQRMRFSDAMALAEEKYPMPELKSEGELPEIVEAMRIPIPEERKGEYTEVVEPDQVF